MRTPRLFGVEEMLGLTLKSIKVEDTTYWRESPACIVKFTTTCGRNFEMYHGQNCCEYVTLEDIDGDLDDLTESPLIISEKCSDSETNAKVCLMNANPYPEDKSDSETWTFYRFATIKGWVVLRWYGTSNGFYSEEVDFVEIFD